MDEEEEEEEEDADIDEARMLHPKRLTYFQITYVLDDFDDSDLEEIESDNRRLLLENSEDLNDDFLSHLVEKYSRGISTGVGKHVLTSEGQRAGDCELWEVPTRVRQGHTS